jgi:hypothetical protein
MAETIQFGNDRRNNNKPSTHGTMAGQSIMIGIQEGDRGRVAMAPNQRAGINLYKSLGKYENIFTKERRRELQITYEEMPQIRYMSTKILAMVLAFLQKNPRITANSFADQNVISFISQIRDSDQLTEDILDKYKATMVRYIKAVEDFQQQRNNI